MPWRDIFLRIERIADYSPVEPDDHVSPPIQYRRDCMRNPGHEDGAIPGDEVTARRLTALIYREYLDPNYLVPKPDKIIAADINEPAFTRRVPGTVIYARPGDWLRIYVKNADTAPHSFHLHGLRYGIDSDGSWPFGTQSDDGRRSDEICPGQTWTYTYAVTDQSIGAWPFHDHYRNLGSYVNRGLFGGLVVLPEEEFGYLPQFAFPPHFQERLHEVIEKLAAQPGGMPVRTPRDPEVDVTEIIPPEIAPFLNALDEYAHAPQPLPSPDYPLHVPLFYHQMSGFRETPVFRSTVLSPGAVYSSPVFTVPATYNYICGIHGAVESGSVTVQAGGPGSASVSIVDSAFVPAHVTVGIGGRVTWTNISRSRHSIVETGGDNLPSFCFNGRTFVGNTPTIVARAGQRIRWYVFNLDLGPNWHNFHPHAQRWEFAGQTIDVRSLGPAESFMLETQAPPVLLLPPEKEYLYSPHEYAREFHLRGDFPVHCNVERNMAAGLVALVRSIRTVYLTPQEAIEIGAQIGLPLDSGDNSCPNVRLDRCAGSTAGAWEVLPNLPEITFMHAVLLANSSRILFWGYGQRADQTRLWDQATGLYTQPVNQPIALAPDENIWSGAHAHLNDAIGTILLFGGFMTGGGVDANTERRAFLFNPNTNAFTSASDLHTGRFYPTALTLADGTAMTLFGEDHANAPGSGVQSIEIFTPGGAGAWSAPKTVPFNYFYYPWTFLLPGGDLFIAGPQKPARRFNPSAGPIVDDPAKQFNQLTPVQRGVNMDGTAVLLPLRPPLYEPRVLIAGGTSRGANWVSGELDALRSAEWIDLSVATPAWQALPDMNIARDKVNSVLLPDGHILILGGVELPPDGGPVEIFDPEDPASGFQLGPNMSFARGYHSAAILLPDGSVIMGGDPNGGTTPNERYRPSYFFKPRPVLSGAPATVAHGAAFSVNTPVPGAIAEVVLMRPGAVTHAFNHNQRYVGCTITGRTANTVTVAAPPDGNIAPPGYYLLFLVDRDRVPSVALWIRLTP